jgi:hypothetical protein
MSNPVVRLLKWYGSHYASIYVLVAETIIVLSVYGALRGMLPVWASAGIVVVTVWGVSVVARYERYKERADAIESGEATPEDFDGPPGPKRAREGEESGE